MNPFIFDQAHLIPNELIVRYYIDDHSYGRLIQSRRNIFLVGERGSGKTMTLLYNTLTLQHLAAVEAGTPFVPDLVGALVPANTPLTHRREHRLLEPFQASVVSEHFLALQVVFEVADELRVIDEEIAAQEGAALRSELEFTLGFRLPDTDNVFEAICQASQRESVNAQRALNRPEAEEFYDQSLSFGSLVLPFLRALRKTSTLRSTHFMLMIDDAHNLNEYQARALNSWIAYRDRELFSFKVATAKIGRPSLATGAGGDILEGHDFLTIDMEQPLHNQESAYGRFAEKVVKRRLDLVTPGKSPSDFFPVHPEFERGLTQAEAAVRARARELLPGASAKQISDYVYKQRRSEYFRSRSPRANRPMYSGFETLVFQSTGVIRNLLRPCWWMWDAVWSQLPTEGRDPSQIAEIPPSVQAETILRRSEVAWDRLQSLDTNIEGCSHEQGEMVFTLFEELTQFFLRRLHDHKSEPGATSFSISGIDDPAMEKLRPLFEIAQKAQLLYIRAGPAKERGRRESYYVPNRILWPARGLDPYGQHARASIKASDLWRAAHGTPIPFPSQVDEAQRDIFNTEAEDAG